MDTLSFVIVGHVDHGKSTLIGRLFHDTGCLPPDRLEEMRRVCEAAGRDSLDFAFVMDHLQEEREQGITIDTAQTFFATDARQYAIIDAPGHREFVKNMVTGASQAEAAVLIVDAVEGVREQTSRHAYLLSLLGIEQVAVLVNKMDLVDHARATFDRIAADATSLLSRLGLAPTHLIPLSAKQGDNVANRSERMPWYEGPTVVQALDGLRAPNPAADRPIRFPIQDVYELDGKRIAVGRVESGTLRTGERVTLLPVGEEGVVRSLEVFEDECRAAEAGRSIGVTVDDGLVVRRGIIACTGALPATRTVFGAKVFWLDRQPLRRGEPLELRLATQQTPCAVERIVKCLNSSTLEVIGTEADELSDTDVGEMVIRCEQPVVLEPFADAPELGRFVLSRNGAVVAGGIVPSLKDEPGGDA